MKDIFQIIRERYSCRTYSDIPIEEDKRKKLRDFFKENDEGPFKSRMRFKLLEFDNPDSDKAIKFGTYGTIRGAKVFIAGAVEKSQGSINMEDFGFAMEKVILYATSLGLNTCWLGGIFRRSAFAQEMGLNVNEEVLPAATPLGYAAVRKSVIDFVIRRGAKSSSRKPWEQLFFKGGLEIPLSEQDMGNHARLLEAVRLAPSASNKQPWRIIKDDDSFHFYLKRNKTYNSIIKSISLQDIDIGIAMCHFELMAQEMAMTGSWIISEPEVECGDLEYIVSWVSGGK
ncbi:nitroreductase family protein [bacterium]|nr:nitroreductase family protein [bacterium]